MFLFLNLRCIHKIGHKITLPSGNSNILNYTCSKYNSTNSQFHSSRPLFCYNYSSSSRNISLSLKDSSNLAPTPDSGNIKWEGNSVESLAKSVALEDMPVEMANPYERAKKVCILCKYGVELDFKNPKLLSQFVSPYTGQLYERHITRLCLKQHLKLKKTIKQSQDAGYMAVLIKSIEFLKDPQLFDPNNPIKPHKY